MWAECGEDPEVPGRVREVGRSRNASGPGTGGWTAAERRAPRPGHSLRSAPAGQTTWTPAAVPRRKRAGAGTLMAIDLWRASWKKGLLRGGPKAQKWAERKADHCSP